MFVQYFLVFLSIPGGKKEYQQKHKNPQGKFILQNVTKFIG